ncbi:hypothetical protein DITRI_Ditri14bG0126300 [Diplodiscus trichospermus]
MRFFLEFVSSCLTTPKVGTNEEVVTAATTPRREETRSWMPPTVEAQRKTKKRVRVGSPGSTTPEWKPSLYVISEDNVTAEKRDKTPAEEAKAERVRVVKMKSSSGSRSKVHVRSYGDDVWRNSMPVVVPTFSPTPFMF